MRALADERPVFHSEADFQHALAWEIREQHPDLGVRLEYPVPLEGERGNIDIWLWDTDGAAAIEVKCWTRRGEMTINGERFHFKDGARNLERYEFWKDVTRTERLFSQACISAGYVLSVSGDYGHWEPSRPGNKDAAFHIFEGRGVEGTLSWRDDAKVGTEWEAPLKLRGRYRTQWRDYSKPDGVSFRYLLLDIGEGLAAGRA